MSHDEFILEPDDAIVREVFAHYGRAFYMANCLERSIAATLLHVEWRANLKPPMTRQSFQKSYDAFFAKLEAMPMGRLIGRLKAQRDVPADLAAVLDECIAARNVLVHHYFWNRAGEFALDAGQRKMIKECDDFCALFERTDQLVMEYIRPYAERHGVSKEALKAERMRIVQDAHINLERESE